jgi:TPR repeat protein
MIFRMLILALCCLMWAGCHHKENSPNPAPTSLKGAARTNEPGHAASGAIHSTSTHDVATNRLPTGAVVSSNEPALMLSPTNYPARDIYEQALQTLKSKPSEKELARAVELLREASNEGNAAAEEALALCYLDGIGVKKSVEEAVKWLSQSSEHGYPEAEFKLASLYARGFGVTQDFTRAAELARKAAEAGHVEAEYNLATLYASGRGVPRSATNAAFWFKKAAEAGHPTAQSNVGVLYASGKVFEKNFAEAVRWWRKAAEQGQRSAQFNLAQALLDGKEIPRDLIEAYKWASLAAEQGDQDAAAVREEIAIRLSPSDVGEGLRRARDFKLALIEKMNHEHPEEEPFVSP